MSRQALSGIGRVIKANTIEKSIDELRAEGKKRVRVVSSERVMAIIQAIVDDTIASEVGEITKRDRDRIVSDTQDRFSRVLKMQQDLEQDVDDLRTSLRSSEVERERLRADKALLETQVESARRAGGGDDDAVARLGRDLARVREAVERAPREPATIDETALSRVAEKLAARDSQTVRRIGTEFDDLRARLDAANRDAAAARDAAMEKLLQRVKEEQREPDPQLAARLDREFRTMTDQIAKLREEVGRRPAALEEVSRLHDSFDALEKRIHGVERSSSDLPERISSAVLDRIGERAPSAAARHGEAPGLDSTQLSSTLRRLNQAAEEARRSVVAEMESLRASVDGARKLAETSRAEQLRDLEERIAAGAALGTDALARSVERLAERTAAIDGSLKGLRGEFAVAAERDASAVDAAQVTETLRRLEHASGQGRERVLLEVESLRTSLEGARALALSNQAERLRELETRLSESAAAGSGVLLGTVEGLAERTTALDGSLQELRGDLASIAERTAAEGSAATTAVTSAVTDALAGLRSAAEQNSAAAARTAEAQAVVATRTAEAQADLAARLDGSLAQMRADVAALAAHGAESAERQDLAVRSLREHLAQNATGQAEALAASFKGSLDQALDKITKTMQAATARPIEINGEATDVLLARIFDGKDGEVTSNLDQLDVEERRSKRGISKSVGRLREMTHSAKSASEQSR